MRWRALSFYVLGAATAACSLVVSLDELGGGQSEAGADAPIDVALDAPADAGFDAGPMCDPTKPFTTVRQITELDTTRTENHASLSPDELQIWFSSDRAADVAGPRDIFTASRTLRTDPFGPATMITELATPNDEGQPWIGSDLRTIAFARQVNSNWDLYLATRQSPTGPFGTPGAIAILNTTAVEWMPVMSSDGGTIYFVSDREGGTDIWSWPYGSSTAPARVTEIDTASAEQRPCISADSLWLYWSSNRTDITGGKGALEIFFAHRASVQDQFSNITLAPELSTSANEDPDWLSPDLCRLYFHSNRTQGMGAEDLWIAERSP